MTKMVKRRKKKRDKFEEGSESLAGQGKPRDHHSTHVTHGVPAVLRKPLGFPSLGKNIKIFMAADNVK